MSECDLSGIWFTGECERNISITHMLWPDTLQTPDDTFPPAQSLGVWEVHGAIVIGPEPEQ